MFGIHCRIYFSQESRIETYADFLRRKYLWVTWQLLHIRKCTPGWDVLQGVALTSSLRWEQGLLMATKVFRKGTSWETMKKIWLPHQVNILHHRVVEQVHECRWKNWVSFHHWIDGVNMCPVAAQGSRADNTWSSSLLADFTGPSFASSASLCWGLGHSVTHRLCYI